jgi:hypothetical protein
MPKLEFKKKKGKFLSNHPYTPYYLGDLFVYLFTAFEDGELEQLIDDNGNVEKEAGSIESIFIILEDIYSLEIDNYHKLEEVERVLLYMVIRQQEMTAITFLYKSEKLTNIDTARSEMPKFWTNPIIDPDMSPRSRSGILKANGYQEIIINWMTQLRDALAEEIGLISTDNKNLKISSRQTNLQLITPHHLFIEYFTEGTIERPSYLKTDVAYFQYLAEKYGNNAEVYKKAISRVRKITKGKFTEGQQIGIINNLTVVLTYFKQKDELTLVKTVEDFAKRIGIYLFE